MQAVAVDVMGGDRAPKEIMQGALEAAREQDVTILLVGPQEVLDFHLKRNGLASSNLIPVAASQVVGMAESPTDSWKDKQDSSIAVGVRLVKEGRADAFLSAGNTGAIVAASLLMLGTMEGADRPAISSLFTTTQGKLALVLDIGATPECRATHLAQFGRLGSDFMAKVFKYDRPTVGLLSNGEEENKGTRVVKEAHQLLKKSGLNFIGNIEGFDVPRGKVDVIVTDGFTGNVMIKLAESLSESIFLSLKQALGASPVARATKMLWGPPIRSVVRQWDYSTIGGAPLLGVNGNIVMAHGDSSAADIKDGIRLARQMITEGWVVHKEPGILAQGGVHLT